MSAPTTRKSRTYKATDDSYDKAMRRAKKEKTYLTNVIEDVVDAYSQGLTIKFVKFKSDETSK